MGDIAVVLVRGTTTIGTVRHHEDGTEEKIPAQFAAEKNGGTVAVGLYDLDAKEFVGEPPAVFGDYDPVAYLSEAYKRLGKMRRPEEPDLKKVFTMIGAANAGASDTMECPLFIWCDRQCAYCKFHEWMEEGAEAYRENR